MIKMLINPYTYVANLAAILTCWIFVKSVINQQGFIWMDKIFLVLVCLSFLLIVFSATYGNFILLWAYSSDHFKNKKNLEDIIISICNKNPLRVFKYLKLPNYQFREVLFRNLEATVIRNINDFNRNEICQLMEKIMNVLRIIEETDLKQKLLRIVDNILKAFPDILKYDLYRGTINILMDFVNLQIKDPLMERQDFILNSLNVMKYLKFEKIEEKNSFNNWRQNTVNLINVILEPFILSDENKKLDVNDHLRDRLPTIMIISNAYKDDQEEDEEQNYENLKRLKQIKELLIT